MTAGWVAASTRGRSLLHRTIGPDAARALATTDSWQHARSQLATTAYGASLTADADRRTARAVSSAATIWQLRVLSGWLPPTSTGLARAFAAPVEIAQIEHHLARLDRPGDIRAGVATPVPLGSLGTAMPRAARATTSDQVRDVLARSAWGDPGGNDRVTIGLGLRVAWARRLLRQAPAATEWVLGAAAVLIARERFVFDRDIPEIPARGLDQLLGTRWHSASSCAELADHVPKSASWSLLAVTESSDPPSDLWRSELAVIRRVSTDATKIVDSGRNGRGTVTAVMALLLVDLWRVTAAIESAGRAHIATEAFDEVA
ncbi:MAG: hypothetical protein WCA57_16145 [Ilumatobacteraceae bacterium]